VKIILFGGLVVAAVFAGCELAYLRGKRTDLNSRFVVDASLWAIFTGFTLSHVVMVVLYHPDLLLKNPMTLFMVWGGMSSFGGFFGGIAGIFIYLRRKRVPLLPYYEAIMFGFVPVWILGRLGCTITFDHPGTPTDFFLGMADKTGVVRHNLGFYEMLWTIVITAVLYGLRNYRPFEGFHAVLRLGPLILGPDPGPVLFGRPVFTWSLSPHRGAEKTLRTTSSFCTTVSESV
jgi:phosphatidylglycerol:prolipoprotein diacylglycerol transferase